MTVFARVFCLFLFSFSLPVYAQQWYKVELVVFEHLNPNASEQWPVMPDLESPSLTPGSANQYVQPASRGDLSGVADRLRSAAGYRVISHDAWLQPAMNRGRSRPVAISNERIQGQLRFYNATYLHADLNLWLLENRFSNVDATGSFAGPRNPQLHEVRRIRSRELHYFDHPRLGAVLRVEPVSTPDTVLRNMQGSESYSLSE